jgi:hypothetical protein
MPTSQGTLLADGLGCKTSSLPLTYLGVPIHRRKPQKRYGTLSSQNSEETDQRERQIFISWWNDSNATGCSICGIPLFLIHTQDACLGEEKIESIRLTFCDKVHLILTNTLLLNGPRFIGVKELVDGVFWIWTK